MSSKIDIWNMNDGEISTFIEKQAIGNYSNILIKKYFNSCQKVTKLNKTSYSIKPKKLN